MIVMTTLVERIQEALDAKKMSWSKAAVSIGLSPQAPAKWKKGQIGKETLDNLAKLLEVDVGWLLSGQSEGKQISTKETSNVSSIGRNLITIPLLDYVQAGLFHEVGYDGLNPISSTWTTYEGHKPECVFALRVEGMSMSPEFMPGDEIVVDGSLEAKPGSFVIAQEVKHGVASTTFKKYRVIGVNEFGIDIVELVPLNPDFPVLNSTQIDISIIGVVVAHNRPLKY